LIPRVVLHNQVSVDGRIDWFNIDIALYYELTSQWEVDAHLAGSNTIYDPEEKIPDEDEEVFNTPKKKENDTRSILVIPDSRGRVRNWHYLRKMSYWRDMIALCSDHTPKAYLDYLRKRHIEYIIAGKNRVDLTIVLEELNQRYGVKTVLVDSGGTLNGILLRAGLVDEISVLISPYLVGGNTPRSIFRADDLTSSEGVIQLQLVHMEKIKKNIIWLRYMVVKS